MIEGKRSKALLDLVPFGVLALAASVGLTEFVASRFHFHPLLGKPWFSMVYAPWSWLTWQAQFGSQGPQTFSLANIVALLVFGGLVMGFLNLQTMRSRSSKRHDGVHGTAHFADEKEIRSSGLLVPKGQASEGVYVGGWTDQQGNLHYLRHDGPEHIAAIAPTRSGKGVGLVIPTLLTWPHSVVIHDMKGELWNLTAGYRKYEMDGKVLKFDPAAQVGSCSFNPFQEVRLGKKSEVADVQNLVTIIVDPDGKGLLDHWTKTAHAFLTGVSLHLLYKARNAGQQDAATLYDVAMALSDPERDIKELYEEMLTTKHVEVPDAKSPNGKKKITHAVVAAAARDMLNRPEQERGSVLSSAMSYLALYRDPIVAENTRRSDFRIRDLMNHQHPVSLYLVIRPADKDRLKPLIRLILNQIVRVLTREEMKFVKGMPEKSYKHRLLLMLDEFPSFGRLEVFQQALAFIAGYGIKAYLIMQDISQLWAAYGNEESILSNCHVRVAYAPNKPETAEWLSKMLGQTTIVRKDRTVSGKRMGGMLKNVSESFQSSGRSLMTPDEVMRLPMPEKEGRDGHIKNPGEMLIFVAGQTPIKGTQILYFCDPWFSQAAAIAPPVKTDTLASKKIILLELPQPRSTPQAPSPEIERNEDTEKNSSEKPINRGLDRVEALSPQR
jgi:type IV secretion system protein VirD4